MTPPPPPRHPVPDHIPAELREAFATTKGRAIGKHCPFKLGDAVQMHGYAGEMPGHQQTGFRGWVVATVGATILTGITTDGTEWWEYWGDLVPDGTPINIWASCTCCRDIWLPARRAVYAKQAAEGQQLGLFDGAA
jgi:hypothetical protein